MLDEQNESQEQEARSASKKKEITVKLSEPIAFGDETYKELTVKAPRGKHMMLLPKEPAMKDILLVASKSSNIPMAVINELSGEDTLKIVEAMGELF